MYDSNRYCIVLHFRSFIEEEGRVRPVVGRKTTIINLKWIAFPGTSISLQHIHTDIHTLTQTITCSYICIHIRRTHTWTHTHTLTLYVCMYLYLCIHTCTHAHTYTHAHRRTIIYHIQFDIFYYLLKGLEQNGLRKGYAKDYFETYNPYLNEKLIQCFHKYVTQEKSKTSLGYHGKSRTKTMEKVRIYTRVSNNSIRIIQLPSQ